MGEMITIPLDEYKRMQAAMGDLRICRHMTA